MDPTPPTEKPMNGARLFAYSTAAFVSGALTHTVLGMFTHLTLIPGWVGVAVLTLFAALFAGLAFIFTRRFRRKDIGPAFLPYLLALLLTIGPLVMTALKNDFPTPAEWTLFGIVLAIGSLTGARLSVPKTSPNTDPT